MANTITLSKSQYQQLLVRIEKLEQEIRSFMDLLREKLDIEPPYGSTDWWNWAMKKGEKAIKKGEFITAKTDEDLDKLFKAL